MITASIFGGIFDKFLRWIEEGVIFVINLAIQSIADAAGTVLGLLPDLPTAPSLSGSFLTWVSYGEYFFPVTYTLTLGATMLVLWFAYLVVAIPLRWFRIIPGDE